MASRLRSSTRIGYDELESDLAVYRAQYGMPECTLATGCLTVFNNDGDTTPLSHDSDTGLDRRDRARRSDGQRRLPEVQDRRRAGREPGQLDSRSDRSSSKAKAVDTISNSWGGGEFAGTPNQEGDYNNPGIGTFASTGDNGFAGRREYPATRRTSIAVGGTSLRRHDEHRVERSR